MKNKIIILSVFLVPLMIYWALTAFSPNNAMDPAAYAKDMPRVIVFSTPMCGECRKMAPVIEQAKKNYNGKIEIIKVNAVDNKPETNRLVKQHKIYVVPTLVYFDKNGNVKKQTAGYMSYQELEKHLQEISIN